MSKLRALAFVALVVVPHAVCVLPLRGASAPTGLPGCVGAGHYDRAGIWIHGHWVCVY